MPAGWPSGTAATSSGAGRLFAGGGVLPPSQALSRHTHTRGIRRHAAVRSFINGASRLRTAAGIGRHYAGTHAHGVAVDREHVERATLGRKSSHRLVDWNPCVATDAAVNGDVLAMIRAEVGHRLADHAGTELLRPQHLAAA